jgi:hypothetical protein
MKQLVAVGLMCVIACGGSSKPPAEQPTLANKPAEEAPPAPAPAPAIDASTISDAEFDAMMNQSIVMFEAMAAATDAAAGDCHKLSVGFIAVLDGNRAFVDEARRWKGNAELGARVEAWMNEHMDAMMPAMMKIGGAGQQCASDPEFQGVLKRFEELG